MFEYLNLGFLSIFCWIDGFYYGYLRQLHQELSSRQFMRQLYQQLSKRQFSR